MVVWRLSIKRNLEPKRLSGDSEIQTMRISSESSAESKEGGKKLSQWKKGKKKGLWHIKGSSLLT